MLEKPIKIMLFLIGIIFLIGSMNIDVTYDQTTSDGINDYYYYTEINELHLVIGVIILFCSLWINELFEWINKLNLKAKYGDEKE